MVVKEMKVWMLWKGVKWVKESEAQNERVQ
jgi:hypothetical protein